MNSDPIYNIRLYLGVNAWSLARERANFSDRLLCLPPFVDPYLFDYPIENCGILIMGGHEADMDYIDHVILALFSNGAVSVVVNLETDTIPHLILFKKDLKNV